MFLLTPYHPIVYKKIAEHYPNGLRAELLLKKVASENGIMLLGSFDPRKVGLSERTFTMRYTARKKAFGLYFNATTYKRYKMFPICQYFDKGATFLSTFGFLYNFAQT